MNSNFKNNSILITGAKGLVGNAVRSIRNEYPEFKLYFSESHLDDLTDQNDVEELFKYVRPHHVLHLAAKCGGIQRNLNNPIQQLEDNLLMNTNVIRAAAKYDVEKLIAFSSVCVFPKKYEVLTEDSMHDGEPFEAHKYYAHAKRLVDLQIEAHRKERGVNWCSLIPSNIFGKHDFYNLTLGHVVPSLIHKAFLAKQNNEPLHIWGTGVAKREFLYSEDLARICLELFRREEQMPQKMIVSSGEELEIREVVSKIQRLFGIKEIKYDVDKPNGQLSRRCDLTLFNSIFPNFEFTSLDFALEESVRWFQENYPRVRL